MDHAMLRAARHWAFAISLGVLTCAQAHGQEAGDPCSIDAPCPVDEGDYYLSFPSGWDGETALPAIVFFHGHNSSGQSAIKSNTLSRVFVDNGYLLIAPNGERIEGRQTRRWPARPLDPGEWRDDMAFVLRVMDDVGARVPLQTDRVLVSGFSAGGSMAWMMACYEAEHFAGFASISGALRRPIPDEVCPGGPFRMMHIHGYADAQVPLEGRGIGNWHQGDVFESLSLLRETNECRTNPTSITMGETFQCRIWQECGSGLDIQFCLHDGGHGLPAGWAEMTREWFEGGQGS